MANGRLTKYADMATLQIATEAFLSDADTLTKLDSALELGNKSLSRLTAAQRSLFTSDGRFKLVAHQDLTLNPTESNFTQLQSGFSASLFYDTETDEYTFSIRSTEFAANIRDAGDIEADIEIATHGWAFSQIYSMEAFWQYLISGQPVSGHMGITTPLAGELQAFQAAIASGEKINVTGYSLGANLATAFTSLHENSVQSTYLFNGAGTGLTYGSLNGVDLFAQIWGEYIEAFDAPDSTSTYLPAPPNALAIHGAESLANGQLNASTSLALDSRHHHALGHISSGVRGAVFANLTAGILGVPRATSGYNNLIVDIWSQDHSEDGGLGLETAVAASGIRHGEATPIWYENQAPLYLDLLGEELVNWGTGHSILLLADSLTVMAAIEELDTTLTESTLENIFSMASKEEFGALEGVVDKLAVHFLIPPLDTGNQATSDLDFSNQTMRDALHEKLSDIRDSPLFTLMRHLDNTPGKLKIEAADANLVLQQSRSNFGDFLALKFLSPFKITMLGTDATDEFVNLHYDMGAQWSIDQAMTDEQRRQGQSYYSDQYHNDRAQMLGTFLFANQNDLGHGNYERPIKFIDRNFDYFLDGDSRGYYAPTPGGNDSASHDAERAQYIFGLDIEQSENLQGFASANDDHIYGQNGNDTIHGLAGNDYLEGGNDNDHLYGGEGTDFLFGGYGNDTFYWNTGDGIDTILDLDSGQDRIVINGADLSSGDFTQSAPDSSEYTSQSITDVKLHHAGGQLSATIGSGSGSGQLVIREFSANTGKNFGITLGAYVAPVISTDYTVAQLGIGPTQIRDTAYWRELVSNQGQDWDQIRLRFNATDVSNYAGTTGNAFTGTVFEGGQLDDHITGDAGANWFKGLLGDDRIEGGEGHDYIAGGAGSDHISGGAGNDYLFGAAHFGAEAQLNSDNHAYYAAQLYDGSQDRNVLDGGAGSDTISGGAFTDHISGGSGEDLLFGGVGADTIEAGADNDTLYGDSGLGYRYEADGGAISVRLLIAWSEGNDLEHFYDDKLYAGDGNDLIYGEQGADWLYGDDGDDTLYGDRSNVHTGMQAFEGTSSDLSEQFHGHDFLFGGAGTDYLYGEGGDDFLSGGPGLDSLHGGAGDDTYVYNVGDGGDQITDTAGNHTLLFNNLAVDQLNVYFQNGLVFVGTSFGSEGFFFDEIQWQNVKIALNAKESVIERSALDAHYLDNHGQSLLVVKGTESLTEAQLASVVTVDNSQPSSPRLVVHPAAQEIDISLDNNPLNKVRAAITTSVPGYTVELSAYVAQGLVDEIVVPPQMDVTRSGQGTFSGTAQSDHITGSHLADGISGGDGHDTIAGGSGGDILLGGNDNDTLSGGAGDDTLSGDNGHDTLIGGRGDDTLSTAGDGTDILVFSSGDGRDTIEVEHSARTDPRSPLAEIRFDANAILDTLSFQSAFEWNLPHVTITYGIGDTIRLAPKDSRAGDLSLLPYFTLTAEADPSWVPTISSGTQNPGNLSGSYGNDLLLGNEFDQQILPGYGNDTIQAGAGDDVIVLNAMYMAKGFGGIGAKTITAGEGNDTLITPLAQGLTYHYNSGDGHDTVIYDWSTTVEQDSGAYGVSAVVPYNITWDTVEERIEFTPYGEDILKFGPGISLGDLRFLQSDDTLLIIEKSGAGSITIENFFVTPTGAPAEPALEDIATGGPVFDSLEALVQHGVIAPHSLSAFRINGQTLPVSTVMADHLEDVATAGPVITQGTEQSDYNLAGSALTDDFIESLGGNDFITDLGGTNTIYAGPGNDTIVVDGQNTVYAGSGSDEISILGGANAIYTQTDGAAFTIQAGQNEIYGGAQSESGTVRGGSNSLSLGAGQDYLYVHTQAQTNTIDMGDDLDYLEVRTGTNRISMGRGSGDRIHLYDGTNTIVFGKESELDIAVINVNAGQTNVEFEAGIRASDLSFRLAPRDAYGTSTPFEPGYLGFLEITMRSTGASLQLVSSDFQASPGIPRLVNGSAVSELRFADGLILTGDDLWAKVTSATGDVFIGTSGSDAIAGTAGDDSFHASPAIDTLSGLAGNDTFFKTSNTSGADWIDGGEGFDVILGSTGNDDISLLGIAADNGIERIDGNGGNDRIVGNDSDNTLDFSSIELIGVDQVFGLGGNDVIVGNESANLISGGTGHDILVGGRGNDALLGGDGNDVFLIEGLDQGTDFILGESGYDIITGGPGSDTFTLIQFDPNNGIEEIRGGGALVNIVSGDENNNILDFSATSLVGMFGISAGRGNDTITGSAGSELIFGAAGSDHINGGSGGDIYLWGQGNGQDTIAQYNTEQSHNDSLALLFTSRDNIWLSQAGEDLVLDHVGTDDELVFQGWFSSETNQVERFFDHSHEIVRQDIALLVQEMAQFDPPQGGWESIPAPVASALETTMANVWQPISA